MSILFTIFVALNLLLGWSHILLSQPFAQQFLVWSCVLTSVVFGFLAECLVAHWRFKGPGKNWRGPLTHVATNWLLALTVSLVAFSVLALPIFDSVKTGGLIASVLAIEFLAVCSMAAFISARRQGQPTNRAGFLRGFGNYALLNIVSMAVGVGAGRLYLNLFYPGVG